MPLLADLSPAVRARSALAACGAIAWVTDRDAGSTPFYEECGAPMLLATEEVADHLLAAGSGRIELGRHPRLGLVRLAGQFWPVTGTAAMTTLATVRREHADCPGCLAGDLTRVVGLQVVTAAIRRPGIRDFGPIPLDDYLLALPDPLVATGANIATHLNAAHTAELLALAGQLLQRPAEEMLGAHVGAVDGDGFELLVTDGSGGHLLTVPFRGRVQDPYALPDALHAVLPSVAG